MRTLRLRQAITLFMFGLMTAFLVCSVGLNLVLLDKNVQIMRVIPTLDAKELK